jgi:hypothetical protein
MTAISEYPGRPTPLHLRFWSKVRLSDGCWNWIGSTNSDGYGNMTVSIGGGAFKNKKATHVMWFLRYGSWPKYLILHSCDNPHCVNPLHLSEGDDRENSLQCVERRRHFNARKTHCKNGHDFNDANSYVRGSERVCRICVSIRGRNRRAL